MTSKNEKDTLLNRAAIPFIGEFIKQTNLWEVVDHEELAPSIHKQMLDEIIVVLKNHIPETELQSLLDDLEAYAASRETLFFIYGIRVGSKLLRELLE